MPVRSVRPAVGVVLATLALLVALRSAALAHAVLVETSPADGSVLADGPRELLIRFNEPVQPVRLDVIDGAGRPVPMAGPPLTRDGVVRVAPQAPLGAGGYLVSWRVVSGDSHPVGGAFAFRVGHGTAPAATADAGEQGREQGWKAAKGIVRFLRDAALMAAAGGALFAALVLGREPLPGGLRRLILAGAAVAALTSLLELGVLGGLLGAAAWPALLDPAVWRLGAGTTLGRSVGGTFAGLALAAAALALRPSWRRAGLACGGPLATASLALTGHAAGASYGTRAALALHAVAAAFWLGALWPLLTRVGRDGGASAPDMRRFSGLAIPAVAVLVVAGTGVALSHMSDPAQLWTSRYGLILSAKLLAVLALLGLAAANRLKETPALGRDPDAPRRLARNIRAEIALAGVILSLTAVLVHTPPPRMQSPAQAAHEAPAHHRHAHHGHDLPAPSPAGRSIEVERQGYRTTLALAPAQRGPNTLRVALTAPGGAPVDPRELTLKIGLPGGGLEPLERRPAREGPGLYRLEDLMLPVPGLWTVRIEALVTDFDKVVLAAELPVE